MDVNHEPLHPDPLPEGDPGGRGGSTGETCACIFCVERRHESTNSYPRVVNRDGFRTEVHPRGQSEFEVSGNDASAMTALLLRRRREASGSSLRAVAERLGATSRNAYARYERGEVVPSLEKLDALLKAASPGDDFVIREAIRA